MLPFGAPHPENSRTTIATATIASRPTGPLIRKHQCQDTLSNSQPGPTTDAPTTATPNSAKACPPFAVDKRNNAVRTFITSLRR